MQWLYNEQYLSTPTDKNCFDGTATQFLSHYCVVTREMLRTVNDVDNSNSFSGKVNSFTKW